LGKNKYIKTPEILLELFNEYKTATKANPILKNDFKGKDADTVYYELERPLTLDGFSVFVFEKGIMSNLKNYFANSNNAYDNYSTICSHIKTIIRNDQICGGMAGIYNPSITQRLNNLVDKQEHTVKAEQPLFNTDGE